jgi:two-component system, OmpR family, response regulator
MTQPELIINEAAQASRPTQHKPKSRRVLIADDNRDSTESLAILLELSGHEVFTALTGLEAWQLAESEQPEVIFLDIGMPELSGYEVAARIRKAPWGRNATLVAVTGYGRPEDVARAKAAGFDHHLLKPMELDEMNWALKDSGSSLDLDPSIR